MSSWMAVLLTAALASTACTPRAVPSPTSVDAPTATARAGDAPTRPLDCAPAPLRQVEGEPVVPSGATAARLCGGLADNAGFDLTWPADTLRGRLAARLVDRLNRLEPYVQPKACEAILSPGFDLVLAYPDGSRVWIDGDTSGNCANVAVRGGQRWTGADQVLRDALALVESRRRHVGTTAPDGGARCPRRWNDVAYTAGAGPVEPRDPVAVTLCRYHLDRPAPGTITQSADGRLVDQVRVRDPRRLVWEAVHGSRVDPCAGVAYDLAPTQDVVLVRDRYGDLHAVSTAPCWPARLTGQRRFPSSTLTRQVAALLG